MKPIAVWYHCIVSGGTIPISTPFACKLLKGQMEALSRSGLLESADEFHIGINGDNDDMNVVRMFVPCAKCDMFSNGVGSTTEIPTFVALKKWLSTHKDWYVFYHHMKGVTHNGNIFYDKWRMRMEKACVWNWKQCVSDLDSGFDAVGCHWLTPEEYPAGVKSPFFGGTFWWATAEYLLELPDLPAATWQNRFEAESWIGRRRPYPSIKDYYPGWP